MPEIIHKLSLGVIFPKHKPNHIISSPKQTRACVPDSIVSHSLKTCQHFSLASIWFSDLNTDYLPDTFLFPLFLCFLLLVKESMRKFILIVSMSLAFNILTTCTYQLNINLGCAWVGHEEWWEESWRSQGGPLFRVTDRRLRINFGQGFFLRVQWDIRRDPEESFLESCWARSLGKTSTMTHQSKGLCENGSRGKVGNQRAVAGWRNRMLLKAVLPKSVSHKYLQAYLHCSLLQW